MNRLVNIVDEYVSDKLNYLDFANLVKNVNSSLLNDIVNISQTSKIDQRMIAIMTIYLFNYSIFDLSNDSNIYISFIKDIIEDNIIIGFETYQITNDYLIGRLKTSYKFKVKEEKGYKYIKVEVKEGNNVTNIKVRLILNTETNTYTYE